LLLTLGACQDAAGRITPADSAAPDQVPVADAAALADAAIVEAATDDRVLEPVSDAGSVVVPVGEPDAAPAVFLRVPDPAANLPHGDEQLARLCANGQDDVVADVFCGERRPRVTSLAELLALLHLDPNVYIGARGFAITGHSTSLSKRSVSAINPRVIFVRLESATDPLLGLAFTRGEPLVELVTRSRKSQEVQFYALNFTLPCSAGGRECAPGELLTPAIERDWQSWDLYHEEDLKNTAIDCRTCHQPSGPGTSKLLRMQELETPWTHWFDEQTRGGRALLADYYALHGDEPYAGIAASAIMQARGGLAAAFVRTAGSALQPNEFVSKLIEGEVERGAPEQPDNNQVRGQSETWQAVYQAALRAEAIPVPYHDVKITDPNKLRAMQRAYAEYRAGRLAQRALPDIRDVLPDDPVVLAEMGFALDERLEDRALLTAACGLCHNGRLDQTLSRARFHTDLERLSAEEKETAIARLNLAEDDPLAMPPRRIHALSETARARLIALLRR
jgi:hypothetical protein